MPLLGWPADDETLLEELKGSLAHDKWSPNDLLPMLILGSAPLVQMSVERPLTNDPGQYIATLRASLEAYYQVFSGEHQGLENLDEQTLKQVFQFAEKADGVLIARTPKAAGGRGYQLIGRSGYRRKLAAALRRLFPNVQNGNAYIARLIGCGEYFNLSEIRDILTTYAEGLGGRRLSFAKLSLHFEAAKQLLKERLSLDAELSAQPMLDKAWKDIQGLIAQRYDLSEAPAVALDSTGLQRKKRFQYR